MSLIRFLVVGVVAGIAGCGGDDVRSIQSLDGEVSLMYHCAAFESQAQTPAEFQAVRQNAGRILRYEEETQHDQSAEIVQALRDALIHEDDELLELAVARYACTNDVAVTRLPRFPERGSVAPDFAGSILEGEELVDLRDRRGSIVVLNFWATWCTPCLQEYPELVSLSEAYRDSGVVVYGVLHQDRPAAAERWLAGRSGTVETLLDPDGSIARSYRVHGIPQTFVIGRDGNLLSSWTGYFPGRLEERFRTALSE